MKRYYSKSAFSKLAHVHPSTIDGMIHRGSLPYNDKLVDLQNTTVREYLRSRESKLDITILPTTNELDTQAGQPQSGKGFQQINLKNLPKVLDPTEDIDLDSYMQSGESLDSLKKIVDIRLKEADRQIKMQKMLFARGDLVDKYTTAAVMFRYLDILNNRILEASNQLVERLIALIKSKGFDARGEALEVYVTDMGRMIQATKQDLKQNLKKLEHESKKFDDED